MKQTGCRETISFCSLVDQRNSVFRNSRLFDLKVLIPINLCFAVTTSKLIFLFRSLPLWLFVVLFSFFLIISLSIPFPPNVFGLVGLMSLSDRSRDNHNKLI